MDKAAPASSNESLIAERQMPEAFTLVENAALAPLNTLRVAATARWLAELRGADALPALLDSPAARGELLVLGQGRNVLFAGDFPGLVLRPLLGGLRVRDDDGETATVRAEAGVGWDAFVTWTLARGFAGLENLALIPGLVGAAPIQNIGAYGVEVADSITCVEAWDRLAGQRVRLAPDQCAFGYRDSIFKREPERWIVTAVEFRLSRSAPLRLDYSGVREELAAMGSPAPTALQVADAVRRLRRRKLTDPAVIGNAGSFFKNPLVEAAFAAQLRDAHPDAPVHPAGPIQGSSAGPTAGRATGSVLAWIWGQGADIPGNSVIAKAAGTNGNTATTTPSYASAAVAGCTIGTTGTVAMTIADIVEGLQLAWEDCGEVDTILASSAQKNVIDALTSLATRTVDVGRTDQLPIAQAANVIVTSYGTCRVILSRYIRRDSAIGFDLPMWALGQLRPPKVYDMAKREDADAKLLVAEYTVIARNPNSSCAWKFMYPNA